MRQKSGTQQSHGEKVVKDIRRATGIDVPEAMRSASDIRAGHARAFTVFGPMPTMVDVRLSALTHEFCFDADRTLAPWVQT